jgi:hypothetical protein
VRIEAVGALRLKGSPRERGAAQALLRSDMTPAIRAVAESRRAELAQARAQPAARAYLDRQLAFARAHCAPEWEELEGVAAGFGVDAVDLFASLQRPALTDLAGDGCTAWAAAHAADGALLAKNRDIDAGLRSAQQVMLHVDPAHPMRAVLAVGSLGAPGVYSSGINGAGLAVADTAIRARTYGPGWLRYFAMTRLLWTCTGTAEALSFLGSVPHAGGGSLLLADRSGAVAAVEFPDQSARVERAPLVMRTNHFTSDETRVDGARNANEASSEARLHALRAALAGGAAGTAVTQAAELMAAHGADGAALCRHAESGIRTVSTAIYRTAERELLFAPDYPCADPWLRYEFPEELACNR